MHILYLRQHAFKKYHMLCSIMLKLDGVPVPGRVKTPTRQVIILSVLDNLNSNLRYLF